MKRAKLVIVGDSAFAEVAYEYFTHDSDYEVVAFAVESAYLKRDSLCGRPVVPFEEIVRRFPPGEHEAFAAIVYTDRNRLRARLSAEAKAQGYRLASYVSSRAFVWPNVRLGEHCFIFEHNVVQPFVAIGDDVILWSGNHIGHHSSIGSHCFVSSHVVISGFVRIGTHAFMGVNAAIADRVTIGDRCVIGAGAVVLADVGDGRTVIGEWRAKDARRAAP
jgi:sugar O-acyltransferase (sialic acid O-acetyltransferase NeuD family)